MLTISRAQWDQLGAVQAAHFNERLLAYVAAVLEAESVPPCTFTPADIVEAAHRMAARIGARTEQQIARLAVILVAVDLLALQDRHAQSIGRILADEREGVERRLSDAAYLIGLEA
jgi:ABC-type hemin transport system ATPase subunit